MMKNHLIEKKMYSFEEIYSFISNENNISLQSLLDTKIEQDLFTLFINHTVSIKDVEDVTFLLHQNKQQKYFIHGIIDVYDRVEREKLYNKKPLQNGITYIENDHISDLIIRSNLVINVIELNVSNFIQQSPNDTIALKNKHLIEFYTDWHTQLHFKDYEFFNYLFD